VRLTADPQDVGRGLGQVVVVLLELLRDLLERQAVRRVDSGELPPAQVEELGQALIEVRDAIGEVRDSLGVSAEQARTATARARELVSDWPPSGAVSQGERARPTTRAFRAAGADQSGRAGAASRGVAGRMPDAPCRSGATTAVGRLWGTAQRNHDKGGPAAYAQDVTRPGWDKP
jgi:hypothetical protein